MNDYICKCGKKFKKSTNAATTGYILESFSEQHECFGCPYIVVERDWKTRDITKRECRTTPTIAYRTWTYVNKVDTKKARNYAVKAAL